MDTKKIPLFSMSAVQGTALRGIAILLVMLGHMKYIYNSGAWGVDLFLILSGFGLCYSADNRGLKGFWINKLMGVYLPYLIVIILQIALLGTDYFGQLVCSLLGLDFCRNIDKTMWYISFLFLWYIVFFVISKLCFALKSKAPERSYGWLRCLLLFIMSFVCIPITHTLAWSPAAGAYLYVFAFPIGALLYELSRVNFAPILKNVLWAVVFIISGIIALRLYGKEFASFNIYALYAMAWAFVFIAVFQFIRLGKYLEAVFCFFGKYAYGIYLFEGFFIFTASPLFDPMEPWYLRGLLQILCSTVCGVLFWRFAYPWIKKWLERMIKPLDKFCKNAAKSS